MNKNNIFIFLIVFIFVTGCINLSNETKTNTKEKTTPVVKKIKSDIKIVDIKFDKDYYVAGDIIRPTLLVANTGNKTIYNETVVLKVKVKKLDNFFANMYLKTLDEKNKTKVFTIKFNNKIQPGNIGNLSAVFHSVKEMNGKSLAGDYEVKIELYVDKKLKDYKFKQIKVHSEAPKNLK